MAAPRKIKMPERWDGSPVPNPVRWMCDLGHVHPSRRHAVKCNIRNREAEEKR